MSLSHFLSVSFRMPNMPNAKKYLHACARRVSLSAPSVVFPIFSFTFAFAIPCFSISLGLGGQGWHRDRGSCEILRSMRVPD